MGGTESLPIRVRSYVSGKLKGKIMHGELEEWGAQLPTTYEDLAAFTNRWLENRRLSPHTREAYWHDVNTWLLWCRGRDLNPLAATFIHVNTFAREFEARGLAAASVSRTLSGISSWYSFLEKIKAVSGNPVSGADKPKVSRDISTTKGLSPEEKDAILATVSGNPRDHAIVSLLADLGLRVSDALNIDVEDIHRMSQHTYLELTTKGGKRQRRALSDGARVAIERYLAARGNPVSGPLFVTESGRRVDRSQVFRLVQMAALQNGIKGISPHSLRHAFATEARAEGVPLEDVQDAMGHASPRTTRRYDRDRHNLDRDPSTVLWRARQRRLTES